MSPIDRKDVANGVGESVLYDSFDIGYSSDESFASTLRNVLLDCPDVPSASELLHEAHCGIMGDSFDDDDAIDTFDSIYSDGQSEVNNGLVPFALQPRLEEKNEGVKNLQSRLETRSASSGYQGSSDLDGVRDNPNDQSIPYTFENSHTNRDIEIGFSDTFAFPDERVQVYRKTKSEGCSVTSKEGGANAERRLSIRPNWSMILPFTGNGDKVNATRFKFPLGAGSFVTMTSDKLKGKGDPPAGSTTTATCGFDEDVTLPGEGKIGIDNCEIIQVGVEEIHGGELQTPIRDLTRPISADKRWTRTVRDRGVEVADEAESLEMFQSFEVVLESQTIGSGMSSPRLEILPSVEFDDDAPGSRLDGVISHEGTLPPLNFGKSQSSNSVFVGGLRSPVAAIGVSREIEEDFCSVTPTSLSTVPKDEATTRSRGCTKWRLLIGTVLLAVAITVAVTVSLARNEGNTIALAARQDMNGEVMPSSQPTSPSQFLVSSPSQAPTYSPHSRGGRTRAPSSTRTQLLWNARPSVPSPPPSN
jgi:hypothetical protein